MAPAVAFFLYCASESEFPRISLDISRTLALSSSIVAIYGILQASGMDPLTWSKPTEDGIVATLGHPNAVGAFLLIGLAAQIRILVEIRKPKLKSAFRISMVIVTLITISLSMSKGALLGLVAGMFSFCLLRYQWHLKSIAVFLIGLIVFLGITYSAFQKGYMNDLIKANSFRVETYRQSLEIFLFDFSIKEQFIGRGLGTFALSFDHHRHPQYLVQFKHAANLEHAHNEFIEILLETGIIGLTFFFVFILRIITNAIDHRRNIGIAVWTSAMISIVVHNMVCVNLRWFVPWTFWIIGIAMIRNDLEADIKNNDQPGKLIPIIAVCLVPLWIIMFSRVTQHAVADTEYYRAKIEMAHGNMKSALPLMEKAALRSPYDLTIQYDLAYLQYCINDSIRSIATCLQILDHHPNYQRTHFNLAINYHKLYLKSGDRRFLSKALDSMLAEVQINQNTEMLYYLGQLQETASSGIGAALSYERFVVTALVELNRINLEEKLRRSNQPPYIKPSNNNSQILQVQDALLKISHYNPRQFINLRTLIISQFHQSQDIKNFFGTYDSP